MFKRDAMLGSLACLMLAGCGVKNKVPTATFFVDTESVAQTGLVVLDAAESFDADGEIVTYEWSFSDGVQASGKSAQHQFSQAGTYTIELTVVDDQGARATVSQTVVVDEVNQPPIPLIEAGALRGTAPLSVDFSGASSNDPDGNVVSYSWTVGDEQVSQEESFTYVFETPGTYSVSLSVEDNSGAEASDSVIINVSDADDRFTLEGQITAVAYTDVDGDINDPNAERFDNNGHTKSNVQAITNPVTLNGFLTQSPTGQEGDRFRFEEDLHDFYAVSLKVHDYVSIRTFDPDADVDLFLLDSETLEVVASSTSVTAYESVRAPLPGDYIVMLNIHEGTTKYLLRVGSTSLMAGPLANGNSGDFRSGELIVKPKADGQNTSLARAQLGLSHRGSQRAVLARINALNPQTHSQLRLQSANDAFYRRVREINPLAAAKLRTLIAMKTLMKQGDIEYVEPNYRVKSQLIPTDSAYPVQWHYPAINLPQAWDVTTGSPDVTVAIIDSGIYSAHADLQGQFVDGYDFISDPDFSGDGDGIDPNPEDVGRVENFTGSSWHGTHVAGIIGALMNNDEGGVGVAPGARLMPLRALGEGTGSIYDVLQAVRYAAGMENDSGQLPSQAADVINLSLAGGDYSRSGQELYREVREKGIVVVAASGNDNSGEPVYPASFDGVISVAGTDFNGDRAPYSNYGAHVDIAAPGGRMSADDNDDDYSDGILSTGVFESDEGRESGYVFYQGTSMAAPHVAGVVALMKSIHPQLSPDQLDSLIINGEITEDRGQPGRDDRYGYGLIDAFLAVNAARDLANGGETVAIGADTNVLAFSNDLDRLGLHLRKLGSGFVAVEDYSVSEPWLSFEPMDVDEYGVGTYQASVDRDGLSDGSYRAFVDFQLSNGQQIKIQINMRVGEVIETGDAGMLYVFLLTAEDLLTVDVIGVAPIDGQYNYKFEDVAPGDYSVAAGTDVDNDDVVCFVGEFCGNYPVSGEYARIAVYRNQTNINFAVGLQDALDVLLSGAEMSVYDGMPLLVKPSP